MTGAAPATGAGTSSSKAASATGAAGAGACTDGGAGTVMGSDRGGAPVAPLEVGLPEEGAPAMVRPMCRGSTINANLSHWQPHSLRTMSARRRAMARDRNSPPCRDGKPPRAR